jgi:hypothetical protein
MGNRALLAAPPLAALLLAGCVTPFNSMGPETGPPSDPEAVGAGVHAWPWLEHAYHGDAVRTDVAWPLLSVRSAEKGGPPAPDTVLPLFVHSSSPTGTRWGLRPLWDIETGTSEKGDTRDVDLLFPLIKWRNSPERREFDLRPILFTWTRGERSHFVLFPLVFSDSGAESSSTLVLPSYYRREEKGEVRDLHVWPFWGMHRKGTFRMDWTLFPLFGLGRDPEEERLEIDAPFPVFHYGTSKDSASLRILPLLWHERSPKEEETVVFPFWWSLRDEEETFRMVFPFWANLRRGEEYERTLWLGPAWVDTRDGVKSSTDVLWPLFGFEQDPKGWSSRLFPVLWLDRHGGKDSYTHVWPLFGSSVDGKKREVSTLYPLFRYSWDEDSWSLDAPLPLIGFSSGKDYSESHVFPLFRVERHGDRTEGSALLFLAQWKSKGDDESEFRILWRLFVSESTPKRSVVALNPLFRHETNARGDSHWAFLFGMVAVTTEEDRTHWRFLWFL